MAITTLGGLHVEITAGNQDLKTKVKQTSDILKKGRKSLNDNAAMWAKWGGAVVAASAVAATAIFKNQSQNIKELKNLSFAANTLTQDFQRGAFGAAKFGVEQEKYGDILKDVNDKIGDFLTTGAGPMVDFFEQVAPKVGVTADSFKNLSGQQAMGLYVKSLEDANLSQQEMTFHMEAIASDSTLLLPLFKDNAKALNEFTAEAKALGLGLTAIDIEKVSQANRELSAVGTLIDSTLQEATIQIAPIVTALAKSFTDSAKEAGGMGETIGNTFDGIIDGVGFVLDAIDGIDRIFEAVGKSVALVGLGITANMLAIAEAIVNRPVQAVNELIEAFNKIPFMDDIMPVSLTGFGESIKSELEITKAAIDIGMSDIGEIFNRPMPSEGLKKAVSEARAAADELAKITAEQVAPKQEDETGGSGKVEALSVESAKILEELQNRFKSEKELENEKYKNESDALVQSLTAKQITQKEFDSISLALLNEHEQNLKDIKASYNGGVSEESAKILEELQNRYTSEKDLLAQKLTDEQVALAENLLAKNITQEEFDLLAQERNQEHQEALTAIEAQEQAMRAQQVTDSLGALATIMSLGGKKTEKAVRDLAIASAIIKGHESAVAAFAAGMSVGGPFAPATAALYTAASIVQTGMMIAKLKSGSKTPSRPSGSVPKSGGSSESSTGNGSGNGSGRRFDITLVGSTFNADQVRELMGSISEQFSDGVKFNVGQQ